MQHKIYPSVQSVSSVTQSCRLFATPWIAACQASLSITNSWNLPKFMSIDSVMPSNHLSHPLSSPLLPPSVLPASGSFQTSQFFTSSSQSIRVSASTSVLPMNKQDWLDLLAIQRTLKSLLQHHSSKTSILWCSAFFTVQLSHPYMTTGKIIALTRWTFTDKGIPLLFNMLSEQGR